MHLLQCNQVSKSFGTSKFLDNVTFSVDDADKIGLIGLNGAGKSTLLKIISDMMSPDTGEIIPIRNLKINHLLQEQYYDDDLMILDQLFMGESDEMKSIRYYEQSIKTLESDPENTVYQNAFHRASEKMQALQLFDLEFQIKGILNALGIHDLNVKIGTLSGGQKKRLALAEALVRPCDLLILDEPTNHLDSASIVWLEGYLKARSGGLIMITHDRYFLDRIVNRTLEVSRGKLYEYQGNYEYYLEKKAERMLQAQSTNQKNRNLYRKELAWMRAGVQARGTKSKSRIQRFHELQDALQTSQDSAIEIEAGFSRLGNKIIEIKNLSMSYDQKKLFSNFEYDLAKGDRIGIVGLNGAGKTTLLNLLAGRLLPTNGTIDVGSTVVLGYFTQDFEGFSDENQRAIDYIRSFAEYVTTPSGYKISASELMETFLFDSELQWTPISKLSGGELRRLQLLSLLIQSPNVLLLDEPTNNLDLDTLKVFEQYLDAFEGVMLVVSHDRYFLDRTCDKLLAIEAGQLGFVSSSYSDYLESLRLNELKKEAPVKKVTSERVKNKKEKLTFKELRALELLPDEIAALEEKLSALEIEFERHSTDFAKLTELGEKKEALELELLDAMELLEQLTEKQNTLIDN